MGTGRARQMARAKAVRKRFRQVALVRQLQPRKTIWSGENLGFSRAWVDGRRHEQALVNEFGEAQPRHFDAVDAGGVCGDRPGRQHGEGLRETATGGRAFASDSVERATADTPK
jgi:hypothetical protein